MARLVIVSYRVAEPKRGAAAGGLAVGIADALKARRGLWFGWSGRTAPAPSPEPDIVAHGGVAYARFDIASADHAPFYAGFANGTLWPLLHYRLGLMEFDRAALAAYARVNAAFAAALAPLLSADDVVWVHDYQLMLVPRELRSRGFAGRVGFFLHVPFPPPDVWCALPQGGSLLESLLAADLVGFQTEGDRANFLACCARCLGAAVADGTVTHDGRRTAVATFPIGIDTQGFARTAARAAKGRAVRQLRESLGERLLVIGVDRLDYSKGLINRFLAYDSLLHLEPSWRRRVTYLQVAARSRVEVAQYRALRRELDRLAGRINGEHAEFDWTPLRYLTREVPRTTLAGFFRIARVGLVTPMRDGMNLVAKEFVAAQDATDPGVLILSAFAGAAAELTEALIVNPHDPQEIAEALARALAMPLEERRTRWEAMMARLREATAAAWAKAFLDRLEACPGP
ncbi:alpha,alpha-trehalose-phosphate synthase (UDP-forming) [Elioraea thermophila]|uniref:alpha,alpha-trehalose-phosphate synthase (UDP-forming) n=1 Tax=Elioraea thermophila TaxID=2185104 RepID=UPI000DF1A855|nr:trehalose-6-phosphate synthase [Elioraea thermophila]